jgi:16S rRNA (cytidine1402-2'-O)-methyltransferase
LVATPIGNLGDITLRALEVLGHADMVACEDTRMTGKLLTLLGLKAPLKPYHEHNARTAGPEIMARLRQGGAVALVSDAGTPLINDPGFLLVRDCIAEGLPVTALPGANAPLTALQLSGLPSDRFFYAGFPPPKTTARRSFLGELTQVPASLIFLESPNRLAASLADMAKVLGDRPAAVARELTKMHEEVARATLSELALRYATEKARGEVVVVVGPPQARAAATESDLDSALAAALAKSSARDAAAQVAAALGLPRRTVYARALNLTGKTAR